MSAARRLIVRQLLGPSAQTVQDERRLVLRYSRRNGCAGIFMLLWLCGWGAGAVLMGREVFKEPDLQSVLVWGLIAGIAVAIACYVLHSLFAMDELRVEGNELVLSRVVLIAVRRRRLRVREVHHVEIVDLPDQPPPMHLGLEIRGHEQTLLFGKGEADSTLVRWGRALCKRLETLAGNPLAPAPRLDELEAEVREREHRLLREMLEAVGAESEAELEKDPELKRRALEHLRGAVLREASEQDAKDEPSETLPRRIVSWFVAIIWFVFSIVWIWSTAVMTVQMIVGRRWGMACFLPLFWVTSAMFVWMHYALVKHAALAIVSGVRRFFGGGRGGE